MKLKTILAILPLLFASVACQFLDKAESTETQNSTPVQTATSPETNIQEESRSGGTTDKKNLLAFGNGSFVVRSSSNYDMNWHPMNMLDETTDRGWASDTGKVTDEWVVIELPAKTTLKTIMFDTAGVDTEGSAAKNVKLEISDVSGNEGFSEIWSGTLADKKDGQEFEIKTLTAGQWLKVSVKDNFGSDKYSEIMELKGYGDQEPVSAIKNVSGTYSSDFNDFHIKQDGTSIIGCYEFDGGLIDGGVDNRLMNLDWQESGGEDDRGPAIMFFSKDGKKFLGVWAHKSFEKGISGVWNGEKKSDKVGNCDHLKSLDGGNAAEDQLKKAISETGRAKIYGINFDFNSDKIKDESKQALQQIINVLKDDKELKILIEGHTDNVGGDAFNKTLSEKRAASVKAYLIAAGIEEGRLTTSGVGLTKPIAANETEQGRSQNRRVELVKQ